MAVKPRITIVGAGKFGTALALSLRAAGYEIGRVVPRSREGSRAKARRLAARVGAHASSDLSETPEQLVWFCVPDSQIAQAARSAAKHGWAGKMALHSSGALTSDELGRLRAVGASVASVHPMMTFIEGSHPSLQGVPFAIEGDVAAVKVARRIVRGLGGKAYAIRKEDKAAYHAWGTFISPLLTSLLATSEEVASLAGVKRQAAARRMIPILQKTLANYARFGAARGLSGPIVRGDVETVRQHLRVLRRSRAIREVYSSLVRASLEFLPSKNRKQIKRALDSAD